MGMGSQMLVGCRAVHLFTISSPCPTPLLCQIGRFVEWRCVHYQSFAGLEQSLISSWHLEECFTFGLTLLAVSMPRKLMEEKALGGSNQTWRRGAANFGLAVGCPRQMAALRGPTWNSTSQGSEHEALTDWSSAPAASQRFRPGFCSAAGWENQPWTAAVFSGRQMLCPRDVA